jgi:uncharacterized protein
MNTFAKVKQEARNILNDSRGSHDWEHTLRVYRLAEHIGKVEQANLEIVRLAAILHDIGRHHQDISNGKVCHAKKGAEMAREILTKDNLPEEKIEQISHCISSHRFRDNNKPQTLEAKVVFDADKLDAIGAVGVGRAFLFAGEVGAKLHNPHADIANTEAYTKEDTAYREFMVKLRKVKDRMLTSEGRRLARERHRFMVDFFERLNQEVAGKI